MRGLDLTLVNMVREKNEVQKRNERAREYSQSIRKKSTRVVLDFSEVAEYGIAAALLFLLATILI